MESKLSSLIESLVEEVIDEAAKTSVDARSGNLALSSGKSNGATFALLFDWQTALAAIDAAVTKDLKHNGLVGKVKPSKKDLKYILEDRLTDAIFESITGFIQFSKVSGCGGGTYNIDLSAADNSFGPLMYDYALSLAYPNYLTPDRDSVSTSAANVWNFYLTQRKDVQKEILPKLGKGCDLPASKLLKQNEAQDIFNDLSDDLVAYQLKLKTHQKELARAAKKDKGYYEMLVKDDLSEIARLTKEMNKWRTHRAAPVAPEDRFKSNPLAYRYKINKPLGTARLVANSNKFIDAVYTKFGYKIKISELNYIGDIYFQKHYHR